MVINRRLFRGRGHDGESWAFGPTKHFVGERLGERGYQNDTLARPCTCHCGGTMTGEDHKNGGKPAAGPCSARLSLIQGTKGKKKKNGKKSSPTPTFLTGRKKSTYATTGEKKVYRGISPSTNRGFGQTQGDLKLPREGTRGRSASQGASLTVPGGGKGKGQI